MVLLLAAITTKGPIKRKISEMFFMFMDGQEITEPQIDFGQLNRGLKSFVYFPYCFVNENI